MRVTPYQHVIVGCVGRRAYSAAGGADWPTEEKAVMSERIDIVSFQLSGGACGRREASRQAVRGIKGCAKAEHQYQWGKGKRQSAPRLLERPASPALLDETPCCGGERERQD